MDYKLAYFNLPGSHEFPLMEKQTKLRAKFFLFSLQSIHQFPFYFFDSPTTRMQFVKTLADLNFIEPFNRKNLKICNTILAHFYNKIYDYVGFRYKFFRLYGLGFKIMESQSTKIILRIGHSHLDVINKSSTTRITKHKKKNKYKIRCQTLYQMSQIIRQCNQISPKNVYKRKGLRLHGVRILKKQGKRVQ